MSIVGVHAHREELGLAKAHLLCRVERVVRGFEEPSALVHPAGEGRVAGAESVDNWAALLEHFDQPQEGEEVGVPLAYLGREEEPVAEDQVGHVAEAGLVTAEAPDRAEQQVEVQRDQADSGDFAGMKAVLVEKVGHVRGYLQHWKLVVGEVGCVHEDCQVVHAFRDGSF